MSGSRSGPRASPSNAPNPGARGAPAASPDRGRLQVLPHVRVSPCAPGSPIPAPATPPSPPRRPPARPRGPRGRLSRDRHRRRRLSRWSFPRGSRADRPSRATAFGRDANSRTGARTPSPTSRTVVAARARRLRLLGTARRPSRVSPTTSATVSRRRCAPTASCRAPSRASTWCRLSIPDPPRRGHPRPVRGVPPRHRRAPRPHPDGLARVGPPGDAVELDILDHVPPAWIRSTGAGGPGVGRREHVEEPARRAGLLRRRAVGFCEWASAAPRTRDHLPFMMEWIRGRAPAEPRRRARGIGVALGRHSHPAHVRLQLALVLAAQPGRAPRSSTFPIRGQRRARPSTACWRWPATCASGPSSTTSAGSTAAPRPAARAHVEHHARVSAIAHGARVRREFPHGHRRLPDRLARQLPEDRAARRRGLPHRRPVATEAARRSLRPAG